VDPETLCAVVAGHRKRLLEAWRGPAWDAVAAEYGATGATRREALRAALDAVRAWALSLAEGAEIDASLRDHLTRLTDDALREVGPEHGARAGLAAIFANATASTGWWAARTAAAAALVASCPGCGASQQRILCFECQYCGGALYPSASDRPGGTA
jgi:hypothetical protein